MKILVLNSGSSSLKYQLIDMTNEEVIAKGNYERIGQPNAFLTHKVGEDKHVTEFPAKNHEDAIKVMLNELTNSEYGVIKDLNEIDAVGHRIVHGGEHFTKSAVVTDEVISEIRKAAVLAPLHNLIPPSIKQCQKKHTYIRFHTNTTKSMLYVDMEHTEHHIDTYQKEQLILWVD